MTFAEAPMCAVVFVVTTLTEPARLTAAVPAIPALTPTAAMSSLFVAVTATPRKPPFVPFVIVRGPKALASPAGVVPSGAMLCERPVPVEVSVTTVPPSVDFLSSSRSDFEVMTSA